MRRFAVLLALVILAAGCASSGSGRIGRVRRLEELNPGYAVMVARFQYVPGRSGFSEAQVFEDAWYIAYQLSVLGYQSFVMEDGENGVRVGVRATSWSLARALQREIDARRCIDLPDGNRLPVPENCQHRRTEGRREQDMTPPALRLLVGSKNPHKTAEIRRLLADVPVEVADLSAFPDVPDAVEEGVTFTENAAHKARFFARHTGLLTVSDDSGLEVDALDGAPGVYSARFAGEAADYEANNRLLLEKLEGVPAEERTARFRCVIALASPEAVIL
ncbi:MAG: non-canonical purine NTP pyrophosphatase, partial [Planctomycetota bacterium]